MTDEEIYQKVEKRFYSQDFLSFVGMKLEHVERGKVIISCENKKEFSQYLGYMHGGMVTALADTAGGNAASTVLEKGKGVVTSELKIHFLIFTLSIFTSVDVKSNLSLPKRTCDKIIESFTL